jgi:hypothetical protein
VGAQAQVREQARERVPLSGQEQVREQEQVRASGQERVQVHKQ